MLRRVFPLPVLTLAAAFALAGCGAVSGDASMDVVIVGAPSDLEETGLRLSPAGQHLRAATAEGLVTLDASAEVMPGLAERWIVTDDGLSYIFRLRDSNWPDGTPLTANSVRERLSVTLRRLNGTSLGLDLEPIADIRVMTARVVEVRLDAPMPDLLRLLAQPELGLLQGGSGTGPMRAAEIEGGFALAPLPPERRGLPEDEDWSDRVRPMTLFALPAEEAVEAFEGGDADLLLNGRLSSLPLADTGPLSRGTVRLDAALGLFGLRVLRTRGVLADPARREAIAMAIERDTLLQPFNIGGWIPTSRIVAPDLPGDPGTIGERWEGMSIEERRAEASRRIRGAPENERQLSLALPQGPGADILLRRLQRDLAPIGVRLERARNGQRADLELVDRLARYGSATWFLNQFHCSLGRRPCAPQADERLDEAKAERDPLARAALLAEAEAELTASNIYIPLGAPIRWSLVRGGIEGFVENRWGLHPLFPLALRPI